LKVPELPLAFFFRFHIPIFPLDPVSFFLSLLRLIKEGFRIDVL